MIFILYLGGSTILWLKGIIVIIYCPSCRKLCDYTHRGSSGKPKLHLRFPDTEGVSDGTLCYITKTSKWHGLGDTLVMHQLHAG